MIDKAQADCIQAIRQIARRRFVGGARGGIARGMIMGQHDRRGAKIEGAFENWPYVDRRFGNASAAHQFVTDESQSRVQKQHAHLFNLRVRSDDRQVIDQPSHVVEHQWLVRRWPKDVDETSAHRGHSRDCAFVADCAQGIWVRAQYAAQGAKGFQQTVSDERQLFGASLEDFTQERSGPDMTSRRQ